MRESDDHHSDNREKRYSNVHTSTNHTLKIGLTVLTQNLLCKNALRIKRIGPSSVYRRIAGQ